MASRATKANTPTSDYVDYLIRQLKAGTANETDLAGAIELLAVTGTTLSGKQPERIRNITRH